MILDIAIGIVLGVAFLMFLPYIFIVLIAVLTFPITLVVGIYTWIRDNVKFK